MNALDQSTARKTVNWFMFAAMGVVAVAIGTLLYWSFSGGDVLDIKNAPFPVRTIREHPTADGVVILKVNYCKKIKATGQVTTSFVSPSREIFLPASEDRQPPICQETEIPVLIPHELPADKYVVRFKVDYKVNPLRSTIETFDSRSFEVTE